MNKFKFSIGAQTDKGNIKEVNQDAFLCKVGSLDESEFGLFVVCDGLGGLSDGEIASSTVIKHFNEWWNNDLKEIIDAYDDEKIIDSIKNVIIKSNKEIIDFARSRNTKIGTTASVAFIANGKYYIVHIGDSRIYKIDKKLDKLTKDHTHYQKLIDEGKLEEAKNVKRSVLVQCIGVNEKLDIHVNTGIINDNTTFLLCSDGFYNKMNEKKLEKILENKKISTDLIQEYCEQFINQIKDSGERDNITLIIAKLDIYKKGYFGRIKSILKEGDEKVENFIGKTIEDKYTIVKQLGKGGMGSVYLVQDLKLEAWRAVKIISKKSKYKVNQFVEVDIMKRAQHPYLPAVMDISEDSDYVYIIMELITGTTLDKVLSVNGNKIEEDKVIKWAKQIADVLLYLHSDNEFGYKVIYKDLKPSNIMISNDGERTTLIDFGISQIIKDGNEKNITAYTRGYSAPEQFEAGPIDERADIYSFGVTIYQLLSGYAPKALEDGFVPIRQIDPNLSEGIEYILARCIQENVDDRYSSIKEVINDLENIHKIGTEYENKIKARRNKTIACLAGVGISGFIALSGWKNVNAEIVGIYDDYINQGIARREEFKFDEAIKLFEEAQSYMGRDEKSYYEIAKTYMTKGSTDQSIMYLNKVMKKSSMSKDDDLNYLIGKAYFLKDRHDKSIEYFEKVKNKKNVEDDYTHLYNISKELEKLKTEEDIDTKNLQDALDGFELYIDSNTDDKFVAGTLYIALAGTYQNIPYEKMNNSVDKQINILEKAANLNSGDYNVLVKLATSYREKSREIQLTDEAKRNEYVNKSLQMFKQCLSLQPDVDGYKNIGDLYFEIGNFEQAEVNYKSMIELNKDHYSGYVKMASLRYAQGNKAEAIDYIEQADNCKVDPDNDPQYRNLKRTLGIG